LLYAAVAQTLINMGAGYYLF